jgi:hypothetical protein
VQALILFAERRLPDNGQLARLVLAERHGGSNGEPDSILKRVESRGYTGALYPVFLALLIVLAQENAA